MPPRRRALVPKDDEASTASPLTSPSPSPTRACATTPTRPTKRRKIERPVADPPAAAAAAPGRDAPARARSLADGEDEFQQVAKDEFVRAYKVEVGYGGDVYYQPNFLSPDTATEWYDELMALDTYQPTLKMYGRSFPQSRHIAAYATQPGMTLSYSGTQVAMHHPFPPVLAAMQVRLEDALGVRFNHCMLNRYDDGSVYIGKHSDNLNNLVIASVSLGAERTFVLSPRLPRGVKADGEVALSERKSHRWNLANGSLVVMQGRTQEYWKHEIPKELKVKTGRISLTFRQLV